MRNTILKIQSITGKLLLILIIGLSSMVVDAQSSPLLGSSASLLPNRTGVCPGDTVIIHVRVTGIHVGTMSLYLDFDRTVLLPYIVWNPILLKNDTISFGYFRPLWVPWINWQYTPGITQSVDLYNYVPLGQTVNNEVIVDLIYIYNGGTTDIHIREAPGDPSPISGLWDNNGFDLEKPWIFTDVNISGSYPVDPAGPIIGASEVCLGTTEVYSIDTIANATAYSWSYSGTGVTVSAVDTAATLTISPTATSGILTVQGTNAPCDPGAISSFPITVLPDAAVATVTGITPRCIGATTTYNAGGVVLGGGTGAWSSSNTLVATVNSATGVVTPLTSGTTNIIYTIIGGCNGTPSAQQTLTVTPDAAVSAVTGTSPLCIGSTTTYNAGGVVLGGGTGSWSSSNPIVATVNAITGVVTTLTSGTTNIIYTITGGCNGAPSAQQLLTVLPDAAVATVTGITPLCIGSTTTYNAGGVVYGGGTGVWSSSNPIVATVNAITGVVTTLTSGTTNIIYTITGGCNGTPSAQQTLTVTPDAAVSTVTGTSPLCIGATTTYNAGGVVFGGGTGSWSSSNPIVATVNAITGVVTALTSGTTNIIYTITGGCNGTPSAQQLLTVLPDAAVATVTGITPLCIGSTTTYNTGGVVLGGGTGSWSSSNPIVATVNAITGVVTTLTSGTTNIIYTITGGCNGTPSAQQLLTVLPDAAVATVTGITPRCIGATTTYNAGGVVLGGGTGVWSSSNTLVATVNSATGLVTPLTSGTTNIIYTITSGCNGTPSAQQTLTVTPDAAVSTVTGTSPLCIGATTTYNAGGEVLGGGTGSWSSSNPIVATVNAITGVVTTLTSGTTNIIYTITGGCNGTPSAQQLLTVLPDAAVATVTGITPLCIGSTTTYNAGGVVYGGGTGSWSSSNPIVATVNAITGVVTTLTSGTTNIIYTITGGCNGTPSAQQTLTVTPDAAVSTVTGTSPLCIGATTTYNAGGVVFGGGTGSWSSSNPIVATVNAITGVVTSLTSGTTNIIYTITGGCNGTPSAQQTLTVTPDAAVSTVTGTSPLCRGTTATYNAGGVVLGGGTGSWSSSNPIVATVNAITGVVTTLTSGTTNIIYTITGGCNGTPSAQQTLTVTLDAAVSTVTGISPLCIGATTTYNAGGVVLGGGTGSWSSSNPIVATVNAITGVVTTLTSGTTNIIYTITGECNGTLSAQQTLTVTPDAAVTTVTGTSPLCIGATTTYNAGGEVLGGGTGSWSSSNPIVATVNVITGVVTTLTSGTTNIIYTITGGCNGTPSAQQLLTVLPDASVATVTGITPLCIGSTATYNTGGVVFGGGTGSWSSSNPIVATVNAITGVVTTLTSGTTNIIYTITGGCNGTPSAQQTLTVTPDAAVSTVTGTSPLCIGATTTYNAGGVVLGGGTGSWSSSNPIVATVNAITGVVTTLTSGTTNIIYTITGGCNGTPSAQQLLTVLPDAAVATVTGITPRCIGATTTYNAGGVVFGGGTGSWSSSNPIIATVNAITGVVTTLTSGTTNIIYTITGGCNGAPSAQQLLTVLPDAAVATVTGITPRCIGSTTTYNAGGVVLGGGTGVWSSSNTLVATVNSATGLVTPLTSGTTNIIYTITGGCNGTPSAQQTLTVTPDAAVSTVTGTYPLCIGATTTYNAGGVVFGGGTGSWSSSNPIVATVNAITGVVTALISGTTNIIYTITGGCNGTPSAQQLLTVLPDAAVATVTGITPLCIGSTTTYNTGGVVLGGGTGSWSSSNPIVATVNAITGVVTTLTSGTTNIIYTITGGCNGTPSAQQLLTVLPDAAVATVTGITPRCIGATTTYNAGGVVLGGGTGVWSSSNTLVATVNSATGLVTPLTSGTTNIIYTITSGCNGTPSAQQTLTVTPDAAVSTVTGTSPLCIGATTTYNAGGEVLGGGTGSWSSSNPIVATVNAITGVVTTLTSGTTNIIYTITGGCNGTPSAQQLLTVLPDAAVATVTGITPLCIGSTTTYNAGGVVYGGGTGSWSSSNPIVATVNAITGVVTTLTSGTTNIIYTITGGCNGTPSAQQTLTVTPDAAVSTVTGTSPLCIGATTTYNAGGVVFGGGTGSWSSSNPIVATVNAITGVVTSLTSGTTNIIYTITGGCNGTPSAQQTLTVTPDAAVSTVTGTSPLCRGTTATYNAGGVVLGGGTGSWSSSNPIVATVNAITGVVTTLTSGTTNIIYTITGGCNGTPSAQQLLTVLPDASVATVTGITPLCIGSTTTYNAGGVVLGGGTGSWSSSNPIVATVNAITGVVTTLTSGTTNIIYTITGGCNGTPSAQQTLTVTPDAAVSTVTGTSPLCIGATTTYNTGGVVLGGGTGSWSSSNPIVATVNAITGVVTTLTSGTTNIIYTITGGCNGTPSAQQLLTVLPDAAVATVTGITPLCIGETTTYNSGGEVLGGGTGVWSSSNALVATVNSATGLVTPLTSGTTNIIFTITGGCNGTPSAQQTLTVTPDAAVSTVTGTSPLCIGATTTYNAGGVVFGGGTGSWSSSNPIVATVNAITGVVTTLTSGTTNIIYTIVSGCNGTVFAQQGLIVLPNSTLTLTSAAGTDNQTICITSPIVNITYAIGGSGTGATIAGLPAGLTGAYNAGVFTISGVPAFVGTFNYYIVTIGLCSVQVSATGTIKVIMPPNIFNVTATNNGFYCDGDAGVRLGLDNSETGMTYELLYNNIPVPAPTGPIVSPGTGSPLDFGWFTMVGQYSVMATNPAAIPACNAMMNDTINVVMNPIPVVDFATNNACSGDTTVFTITSTGGFIDGISTWQWDFGDGTLLTFNAPVNPVKHIYANTTTYQAILSVTDTNGCHYRVTHPVVVLPHPTSYFSFTNPNCFGLTTQFTDLCQNPPGQGYLTQWIWNFGDGSPVQTINFPPMPVPYNPTHTYASPGTYIVTLTVSNSKGCSDTYQAPVTIARLPVAGFSYQGNCQDLATAFFDNSNPNGGGQITGWHWDFGDAISGTPNTSLLQDPSHTYSVPGPYTVTLIITNLNGCKDTIAKGIMVKTSPLVDFTNDTACLGTATHFWADTLVSDPLAVAQYLWDFGDNNTSLVRNASNTYVAPGTYTVSLTITDTAGCSNVKTHTITVHPSPVAHFTATNTTCQGQVVTFTDQSVANSAYMSRWVWDFGDGSPSQTFTFPALPPNPNTTYTYTNPGTFGVTLTVTNSDGCTHSETRVIEVLSAPVADFSSSGRCVSTAVSFTDKSAVVLPQALSSWRWNFGEPSSGTANTSTLQNPVHTYSTVNTFTVTLITFTANGCSDTITHDVTTQALPVVDFTFTSACMGNPVQFSPGAGMSPGAIGNWLWSFGDGGTAGTQAPVHTYTAPGTYNITLSVTDTAGCSNVKTGSITIKPSPDASFSISGPGCQGDTIRFINTTAVLPSGFIARYLWNFGDGNTQSVFFPSSPDVTHQYFNSGTFNVSLLVVSSDSCSDTYSGIVTIQPRPTAAFMHGSACQGGAVQFTDISNSNTTGSISGWAWDFGDAASGTANQSTLQNPAHTYNTSGTYTVLLSVTLSGGCSDDTTMQVVVAAPPTVDFTSVAGCNGDTTEFTSTVNPAGTQGWFWQFGDGGTSVIPDPIHIYANAGTYQVILTITDTAGCVNSKTKAVVVAPAPLAAFAVSSPGCSGLPVILTDLSSASGGSLGTWYWTFGDGNDTTYNSVLPTFTHTYTQPGTFTITLKVITATGCENTTTHTAIISASPIADFNYGGTCQGQSTQFTDITNLNGGGTLTQHTWNFGDPASGIQNTSTQTNPVHTYALAGTYTVVLTTVNASGCNDSVSRSVVISPKPGVDFYADSLVCMGSTTTFYTDTTATQVAAVTYYNWDFGDGGPHAFTRNASHSYTVAGTYTVRLTIQDTLGCGNTITHPVTIHPSPITQFVFSGVCENSPTHFTDLSIPPTGDTIVSWYWDFGVNGITTDTSTLQNPKFTYTLPATYSITLTTRTEHGCANTKVLPLQVWNTPTAWFKYTSSPCTNGLVQFQDSSWSYQGIINSWQWEFEPFQFGTGTNPSHLYSAVDSCYDVRLSVTDLRGCVDTTVLNVCVLPPFTVDFTNTNTCFGNAVAFTPQLLTPAAPIDTLLTFHWDFGDPVTGTQNISTLKKPAHTFSKAGFYTVNFTSTDKFGCTASQFHSIQVLALPVAGFGYTSGSCDSTITFANTSVDTSAALNMYVWMYGDGTPADTLYVPGSTHKYMLAGDYMASLTVVNATGCMDSYTDTVTRGACIVAAYINVSDTLCQNLQIGFTDMSKCEGTISNWVWTFGDISPPTTYTVYQPQVFHTYDTAGVYTVKLRVSTVVGASTISDSTSRTILVKPSPLAGFSVAPSCLGSKTHFNNTTQANGATAISYRWDFGDAGTADTSLLKSPEYLYPIAGVYTTMMKAVNQQGCWDTVSSLIRVNGLPEARFSNNPPCSQQIVQFVDSSLAYIAPVVSWHWRVSDSLGLLAILQGDTVSYVFDSTGRYNVQLLVADTNGCSDTLTQWITVNRSPVSAFSFTENVDDIQGHIQFTNGSIGSVQYNWDFGNGENSYAESPLMTYADDGDYPVILVSTSKEGCNDTALLIYKMLFKGLYVPNAFAPEGMASETRIWKPVGVNLESYQCEIFNSYGALVWSSIKLDSWGAPLEGWEGYYMDNNNTSHKCPQDVYVWKITARFRDGTIWSNTDVGEHEGLSKPVYGTLTLIR